MIRAVDLTIKHGRKMIVRNCSVEFRRGRVTAIVGPNGAGKTTLLRALCGLIAPSYGEIFIDNCPLSGLANKDRAKLIGYLPQNEQPSWPISVRELVSLGRLPHRSPFAALSTQDEQAISTSLVATDVAHLADRAVTNLSGGESARVMMARVLAGEPAWIMADEPLASLDPPHLRDLLVLLMQAAKDGAGIVTVVHQLDVAAMADDIIFMRGGAIIAAGPVQTMMTSKNLEATFDMTFDVFERHGRTIVTPTT